MSVSPTIKPATPASLVSAVQDVVGPHTQPLLLHAPDLGGNVSKYVQECIDTGWVSSAGSFVTRIEHDLAAYTGAKYAVAVVNGTAALQVALLLAGVKRNDEVLIPDLTFIATANAVSHCSAIPHLCDVSHQTLGMDATKLNQHLSQIAEVKDGQCINKQTHRRIAAVVPMHTFGHPVDLDTLIEVASRWNIPIVEDAAESLGSYYHGQHTGTFGLLGTLSFNGNKTITTGGGGAILTNDEALAIRAKSITTTAKRPHRWEFVHDEVAFNYRMPNINAAMGCAQLERLDELLKRKRILAERYIKAFEGIAGVRVFHEPQGCRSNYWLNTLILDHADKTLRDRILTALNDAGLQSRPIWTPMHQLQMYKDCPRMDVLVTDDLAGRIINVPSSAGLVAANPQVVPSRIRTMSMV